MNVTVVSPPARRLARPISAFLIFVGAMSFPRGMAADAATIEFNRDIRPILSDKCFACHGFDKQARKADLRLDQAESATASRHGTAAIIPGKPDASEVIRRIHLDDPNDVMPPPSTGKTLTDHEKGLLRRWIESGAKYQAHWAYLPVQRPAPPSPAVPTAAQGSSSGRRQPSARVHPIDRFLDERIAAAGLVAAPEADRRTLIRRLSFDLHGLPPDPASVERFVKSGDPQAFERLVDDYLASPRFAERMAVSWLDLVRYADSIGFHGDCTLSVWPYRDWVIRAFHENMPFDRFTREQIAGDLLPSATEQQRIASGFNRLNRMSTEGGAQDKEYLAKYAADRIRTVSTVWLGTTMGCAECHDHKFDPFTTRDFYRLEAFFADIKEKGFYEKGFAENDWGPKLSLPTPAQTKRLAELDAAIRSAEARLDEVHPGDFASARVAWAEEILAADKATNLEWRALAPFGLETRNGATLTPDKDHWVVAGGPNPDRETYTVRVRPGPGVFSAIRLETGSDEQFAGNRIARSGISFVLTEAELNVEQDGSNPRRRLAVAHAAANLDGDGFPALAAVDGNPATGWSVTSGHSRECQLVLHLAEPLRSDTNTVVTLQLHHDSDQRRCTIAKFRVSITSRPRPSHDRYTVAENALKAIRKPEADRTDDERKAIATAWRKAAPSLDATWRSIAALKAERSLLLARIPTTLVTEATQPRLIRILPRGNWMDDRGLIVEPGIPEYLGRLETGTNRATRLDLARWLTSPDNPLTSRVLVNRLWRQFFGNGLCRTLDDVGSQGDWPAHPELVDWLAAELLEPRFRASPAEAKTQPHPWDIKHLVRVLVTSAAYRRSSIPAPDHAERDPQNRLLARQNRFRLDAEFVRDNALAIAGLLVEKVGGPSVRPFQPDGYWLPLNFPKREYVTDVGDAQYRRGVYMHWQRTFLHPSLVAFDAPGREECTASRVNSNTPAQALVLLNDPNFVEAARALASQAVRSGGSSLDARLTWIWRRALSRMPDRDELAALRDLYAQESGAVRPASDGPSPSLASKAGVSGQAGSSSDLAAMTSVARAVLNLHETITRN